MRQTSAALRAVRAVENAVRYKKWKSLDEAERIGRETVTYVSNIYKYYITYKLIADQRAARDAAKEQFVR